MFFLLIQVIANSPSGEGHFCQTGCEGFLAVTVGTADIEHDFVAAELQAREAAVARVEFSEATAGEHERRDDQTEKAKNLNRVSEGHGGSGVPAQSPSFQRLPGKANDEDSSNGCGTVEAIIGRCLLMALLPAGWRHRRDLRFHHGQNISDRS